MRRFLACPFRPARVRGLVFYRRALGTPVWPLLGLPTDERGLAASRSGLEKAPEPPVLGRSENLIGESGAEGGLASPIGIAIQGNAL